MCVSWHGINNVFNVAYLIRVNITFNYIHSDSTISKHCAVLELSTMLYRDYRITFEANSYLYNSMYVKALFPQIF